jgi:hypothetical protein
MSRPGIGRLGNRRLPVIDPQVVRFLPCGSPRLQHPGMGTKLSTSEAEARRRLAVARVNEGRPPKDVATFLGVSRSRRRQVDGRLPRLRRRRPDGQAPPWG